MNYSTGRLPKKTHIEIVNQSAEQLIKYGVYLLKIEEWYNERGLELPKTALTNYKDAMFHYKKIYEHSDIIKVFQEQYAMEEHLIRAYKDAIIRYMNIMRQGIESVYHVFSDKDILNGLPTLEKCESSINARNELKSKYEEVDFSNSKWIIDVMELYTYTGLSDTECIKNTFAIYYQRHINDLREIKIALQKCIHLIANFSLRLRINGTEIYRPMNDNDYNDECVRIFGEVKDILDELALGMAIALFPNLIIEHQSKAKVDVNYESIETIGDKQEREIASKQVKEEFLRIYSF